MSCNRRAPLSLKRTGNGQAASPAPDPLRDADDSARAAFGMQFWFSGNPLAAVSPDSVTPEDLGDLSTVFPSEEQLAALRLVKPDYRLPPLEERTRRFLSDYLLCASFLEYAERSRRLAEACGLSASEVGNVAFWTSRCRSVAALISSLPPSREKSLLTLRYINGHSIEACAPVLHVSRRTAYRIHNRALALAARALLKKR